MFLLAPFFTIKVFSKPDLTEPMRWMALAVVPMAILILHAQLLKGLKRIRDSQLVQSISIPALCLLGLYIFQARGVNGAVWAYAIASVLTAFAGYCLWRTATPQLKDSVGRFKTGELLCSSMPLFWVAFMGFLMNWAAIFMLGVWSTSADVGIFSVATRTATLITFILISIHNIAAPKFAALYKQGDMETLGSVARSSTKLMTALATPLFLLFILAPGWVMSIFGSQFADKGPVLALLAVGQFINVAAGSVGFLLMMSGNEQAARRDVMLGSGMNLILNMLLIPPFGLMGAAVATSMSWIVLNLLLSVSVYRILGINILWSLKAKEIMIKE
jgi:O-antigen/teichoic acid export membrane protein